MLEHFLARADEAVATGLGSKRPDPGIGHRPSAEKMKLN
ncbi:hypothetical protein X726_30680 [Mesorhizobium sp. L103C105A0]|nr:hypothetical protein X726_30680 [Mesorhizobium sp. L103C105A0]